MSRKALEENDPNIIGVIAPIASQSVVADCLNFASHDEACEVVVVKECDVIENSDNGDDYDANTATFGSTSVRRVEDGNDTDNDNTNDLPMMDFISAEVLQTIDIRIGKAYPVPFVFEHVEAYYYATFGGAP